MDKAHKLDAMQIEAILDRLVPILAKPEDHGFFRGVLGLKLESVSSGHAAHFINELLAANQAEG